MTGFELTKHKQELRRVAGLRGHKMDGFTVCTRRHREEHVCYCVQCGFALRVDPLDGDHWGRATSLDCEVDWERSPLLVTTTGSLALVEG